MDAREQLIRSIVEYLDTETCSHEVDITLNDALDALLAEHRADQEEASDD